LHGFARAHLVRCYGCGVTFAGRLPTEAELGRHYRDYGHAWHDSSITRLRYRELLDSFEPYRNTGRLLDVGCGAGFFLDEGRARGWQVCGTEYGEHALALARGRGHEVVDAPLELDSFGQATFDVVTAFEVFEHVRDPMREAAVLAHVLRRGGLLYCTTPNFNSLTRRLLRARWSVIDYPEHLWYFTPKTLRSWLTRSGFVAQAVTSSGVSLSRWRAAVHRAEPGLPTCESADERLRTTIEQSHLLRRAKAAANRSLAALGAGDTVKGWFRRGNL
jgi:2-polyprenyl-3-methyl-5-hydroxy-6-metoxy-1,4-benzoquinol methylase